ncbi:zinc fingers and homeoboxes protein 3-like [Pristis pectinata]|uniref:zinc fingers and homeoboxes protein 3-like n=1 Tax=Pristis pectinata TaxID=685728 RepID=UPI00223E28C6|nr:zinc fingers and homeoboxes protein 3-like [Pristis pectinata]XP_051887077.1 zinc fingers and homeoboxes protein 3-like [Pristis pectinata]XP_051887078.1 zinc fingers and homeoboxes protein 3-like [Pristis pectinata]XP_051887079.1 zinc fingers and homeoboxes protein 3-like [Pristis pectinata]XP_051887080.1 zinc fingers and homeoboxes protein 3-like [Pristis pectinata]XP_051887081.1 zinc fingers and homeoboxes protein 3-like [Pristis pectinata]
MASKRKSTTPCMIPAKTLALQDPGIDISPAYNDDEESSPQPFPIDDLSAGEEAYGQNDVVEHGGFECKYCDYTSQDYHAFTVHVESVHSDASADQLYVCVECNFSTKSQESLTVHNALSHASEGNLKVSVIKKGSQSVPEQNVPEIRGSDTQENGDEADPQSEISISKTPIMKMLKAKPDAKRISVTHPGREEPSEEVGVADEAIKKAEGLEVLPTNGPTNPGQAVNGTTAVPVPVLQAGMAQIVPVVQQPAPGNNASPLPKVMIPLSSIPTYNAAMDSNSFLNNSFSKFPYPTKAELCWLTVVTKYPEEQLKIWFTAQRLKHGISWTPEEIEDARKKMFSTIIQGVPQQTITVLPGQVTTTNGGQHLFQANFPCQLMTQAGNIVVTQPGGVVKGVTMTGSPVTVNLATVPKQQDISKFQLQKLGGSTDGPGVKVLTSAAGGQSVVNSGHLPSPGLISEFGTYKYKKTKEQLAALKQSFLRAQFPEHEEVERLVRVTGLQGKEIRKWFSDRRYNYKNLKCNQSFEAGHLSVPPASNALEEPPPPLATPGYHPHRRQWQTNCDFTPPKFKGKSAEQLSTLEHSYGLNPFPPEEEVDRLRAETKMTRREIDLWFSERRKVKLDERGRREDSGVADSAGDEEEEESDGEGTPSDSSSVDMKRILPPQERLKVSPLKICVKEGSGMCVQPKAMQATKALNPGPASCPNAPKYKGQNKKTVHQLHLMKLQFMRTQWPTVEEYDELAISARLPRTEVVRWFGDARYALKNGQLKWYDDYKKGIYAIRSGSNSLITDVPAENYRVRRTPSKKSGKAALFEYYTQHRMLHEEDLDRLCEKSSMSYEQVRDWFAEKQTEDAMYMSDFSNEDQQSTNGESDKAKGCLRFTAEEAYSDVTDNSDNWDVRSREGPAELNEFDAENISEAE